MELAPYKITVNNIAPGAIYTTIDADIEANPEIEEKLMAEIPWEDGVHQKRLPSSRFFWCPMQRPTARVARSLSTAE